MAGAGAGAERLENVSGARFPAAASGVWSQLGCSATAGCCWSRVSLPESRCAGLPRGVTSEEGEISRARDRYSIRVAGGRRNLSRQIAFLAAGSQPQPVHVEVDDGCREQG